MENDKLIPHLFRQESGKMIAVLGKMFGFQHLDTAEDITNETFLLALETWTYQGIPDNPRAWLYAVAKNKTRNVLKREQIFKSKILPNIIDETGWADMPDLSDSNIVDSQLQMLFAICHPVLRAESQVTLALRILCGFGISEIADAFLTNKETINKRLLRAKEALRNEQIEIVFPTADKLVFRLGRVLATLYLLFNEGYYSEGNVEVIRKDLCWEAMRLTHILVENQVTNVPETNALLSLMYFQASRFDARTSSEGEMLLYDEQDVSKWNQVFINRGAFYLHRASTGSEMTTYHVEAAIGYWHTVKTDSREKWESILSLYNQRLIISYSPIAALNRAYALSKVHGSEVAIADVEKLQLTTNPYYFTLLGVLYQSIQPLKALELFQQALELARTPHDRSILQKRINAVKAVGHSG